MQKIFDTHAHYDDNAFDKDRDNILEFLPKKNIGHVINCAVNIPSSIESIKLSKKYPYIKASIGLHPQELSTFPTEYLVQIANLASNPNVVAIGEIGLDYHYDDCASRTTQIRIFEEQIELANKLNLPIIVHDRDAHADTLDLLTKHKPKGIVHCFSGSVEMAQEIIRIGMYIGIGGAVTFKNTKKPALVAQNIPLSKIVLETDAPYMTPVPYRGTRCDSTHIMYTAAKIAELRSESVSNILNKTYENACNIFGL